MYQKTIVVGHLSRDPEMRYTPSGVPVTSFSVATNRKYTNKEGNLVEQTTWFRVTVWRKLAETCARYLHKGSACLCEGEIDASAWQDKNGDPRASLELTASNVRFIGSNGKQTEPGTSAGGHPEGFQQESGIEDADLPF